MNGNAAADSSWLEHPELSDHVTCDHLVLNFSNEQRSENVRYLAPLSPPSADGVLKVGTSGCGWPAVTHTAGANPNSIIGIFL